MAGTIRVSIAPAKAASFVVNYLYPFYEKYPLISFEFHEESVKEQMYNILSGISDFGITNVSLEEPHRFTILSSERDELIVIANKNNPWFLKETKEITLKALEDIPISITFGCLKLFEIACLSEGITPKFVTICTSSITALQLANLNLGIAIIPAGNQESFDKNLVTIPIISNDLYIHKILYKAKNKVMSPIVNNFLEFYLKK